MTISDIITTSDSAKKNPFETYNRLHHLVSLLERRLKICCGAYIVQHTSIAMNISHLERRKSLSCFLGGWLNHCLLHLHNLNCTVFPIARLTYKQMGWKKNFSLRPWIRKKNRTHTTCTLCCFFLHSTLLNYSCLCSVLQFVFYPMFICTLLLTFVHSPLLPCRAAKYHFCIRKNQTNKKRKFLTELFFFFLCINQVCRFHA